MSAQDIRNGTRLAPDEAIVWRGAPSWRGMAREALHLRGVTAYMALLLALDAYQAWAKAVPLGKALHDSVPLAIVIAVALGNIIGIAWVMGRTTRFTITDRRVILDYGIAIPATLSLPFSRLQSMAVAVHADHTGDIVLTLAASEHMPFLKLWPYARPWRVTHPEPILRCVPQAAVVAGLLARALATRETGSQKPPACTEARTTAVAA